MNKFDESISNHVSFHNDDLINNGVIVDKSSNDNELVNGSLNEQSQKDFCELKVPTKKCFSFRTPNSKFTSKYVEDRISLVNSPSPTKAASSSFDKLSGHESVYKFNKFLRDRTPEKTPDKSFKSDSIINDTTTNTSVTKSIIAVDNRSLDIPIAPLGRGQKLCTTLYKRNFIYPVSDCEKMNQTNCKELVREKMLSTSDIYSEFKQSINYRNHSNSKQQSHSTPNVHLVNSLVDYSFHMDTSVAVDESSQELFSQELIKRGVGLKTLCKKNILHKLEQTDFTDKKCHSKSNVNLKDEKKTTDSNKNQVASFNLRIEENQSVDSCQTLLSDETNLIRKCEVKNNKFNFKAVKKIYESKEDETKDGEDVKLAKQSVKSPKQTENLANPNLALRRRKRGLKRNLRETKKTNDEMVHSPEFHSLFTDVRTAVSNDVQCLFRLLAKLSIVFFNFAKK